MRPDYAKWLAEQKYAEATQAEQIQRVKKVEEFYGNLDEHRANGTFQDVIKSFDYTIEDEKANKPNPSRIRGEGNVRAGLQSFKNAIVRYQKFINDSGFQAATPEADKPVEYTDIPSTEESLRQRFSLERYMQAALRRDIAKLEPSLRIIDDGAERAVPSGLIDITCEDDSSIVVVELKAGTADMRAIAQILGYMGEVYNEEGGRPVRGVLVAQDFDERAKAAARVVSTLKLMKYSIEFTFAAEE